MTDADLPKEVGFYWAKQAGYKWYNCIIRIHGTAPYLRYKTWVLDQDMVVLDQDRYSIVLEEIGPKIPIPI